MSGLKKKEKRSRDPSHICHIPRAWWPNTCSARLGFRRMDYSAGLVFGQVGSLVQIRLSLHVSTSHSVREDNTALISPVHYKSLYHANYVQPREYDPRLTAESSHCFGLLPKLRQFIKKTAIKNTHRCPQDFNSRLRAQGTAALRHPGQCTMDVQCDMRSFPDTLIHQSSLD